MEFYETSPADQAERLALLVREALPVWGFAADASVSLVKYRENAVFEVRDASGRFAMRVHRSGYHRDADLLSELQWMQALGEDGIPTPSIRPAVDGSLFRLVRSDAVPEPRQVDVLTWIDGRPLGSLEESLAAIEAGRGIDDGTIRNYEMAAELMARLHSHAARWTPPTGFVRQAWDLEGLLGENPLWGRFWELESLDSDQRALLLAARERAAKDLAAFGEGGDRFGLIHCDFIPDNLLIDASGIRIIDFDDAGYGWHLFDIATSLFALADAPNFDALLAAFVRGYRRERALPDAHLAQLPLFFLIRGLTYLGWVHTRKETEAAREIASALIEATVSTAVEYVT